jgi:hypothetical protein
LPTELKKLTLTELSLVDRPANPLAIAPIFKADNSNGETMTEETEKMAPEMEAKIKAYMKEKGCDRDTAMKACMKFDEFEAEAESRLSEVETLKADVEKLKADNEALRKSVLEEGYKITAEGIEKKAPEEFIEIEGEQINKADIPAPILKRLEEAEIEKAENAIQKRCKETLPNISEDHARVLLKAHDDLAEEEAKKFAEFMQALDNLFDEMTEEVGKSAAQGDMEDPNEKLNALAKAHQEEHNTTFAQAYAAVVKTDAGKALVKKAYQKD